MKIAAKDKQKNGVAEPSWPTVLGIDNTEEFRQSLAVAELAVRLCALKIPNPRTAPTEKENLDPKKFLEQAWELIQSARQRVLRPQTDAEYLAKCEGSHEAAENVVARILDESRVPFEKLCDSKRNKGDTEIITFPDVETGKTIEVEWRVYRGGERAFDNLFWDYWNANSIIADKNDRTKYGQGLLESWKRVGVPPNDFLALARFRREQNRKRVRNLKKKPKTKRRRLTAKARA